MNRRKERAGQRIHKPEEPKPSSDPSHVAFSLAHSFLSRSSRFTKHTTYSNGAIQALWKGEFSGQRSMSGPRARNRAHGANSDTSPYVCSHFQNERGKLQVDTYQANETVVGARDRERPTGAEHPRRWPVSTWYLQLHQRPQTRQNREVN